MIIGFDASCILPSRTGIGNYTLNLLKSLLRLDRKNQYRILLNSFSKRLIERGLFDFPNVRVLEYRIPGPLLLRAWRYVRFPPIESLIGRVDLFHSPSSIIPPQIRGKRLVSVYDLFFMERPSQTERLGGQYLLATLPKRIGLVNGIITSSHHTRQALIEKLGVPEKKIRVIYAGVDTLMFRRIFDEALLDGVRREYCLPRKYLLCVATLEPRKNLEGLCFAYRRLKEIMSEPPKLVLVGRRGPGNDSLRRTVKDLDLQDDVIVTGYVSNRHLPPIINGAIAFVYPSLHEGFGMPVLEAMACGVPVVTSNNTALRELFSEVSVMVDPHNYFEMAEKLKELITSYRMRETLSTKAQVWAERLTWDVCARKTLAFYEEFAAQ